METAILVTAIVYLAFMLLYNATVIFANKDEVAFRLPAFYSAVTLAVLVIVQHFS